jgi:hypothetical protein
MAPSTSGREEGAEKRGPLPHRCNDRVEDLLQARGRRAPPPPAVAPPPPPVAAAHPPAAPQAAFTFEFATKIRPAYRSLAKCLRSEPGCAAATGLRARAVAPLRRPPPPPQRRRSDLPPPPPPPRREEPADPYVVITDPSLYTDAGAVRRERKPER